jgi:type II secretory pathway predicted ATPase ExeA
MAVLCCSPETRALAKQLPCVDTLTRSTKSALYSQIQNEIIESKEQHGKTMVLIIDEAQLLQVGPLQELRLLTNFKMDSEEPFILILAGQADLARVMDYSIMEPLAQRLRLRYNMPPLSEKETAMFVQHQLKLAGTKEPIFKKDALAALHAVSYGIPRRIGSIASTAMFAAMSQINTPLMLTWCSKSKPEAENDPRSTNSIANKSRKFTPSSQDCYRPV